jgi:hypothetical protein
VADPAWERYRTRVRDDFPLSSTKEQRPVIGDILARFAELDAHICLAVRGLPAAQFRALGDELAAMASAQPRPQESTLAQLPGLSRFECLSDLCMRVPVTAEGQWRRIA